MTADNQALEDAIAEPKGFGRTFWMLNIMEMWERLAYYGLRVVAPIYIMQADSPGGLHFTSAQKGKIYAGWNLTQSFLPMFTGGYADRYGYKLTIFVSVFIKILGYLLMATQRSYAGFLIGTLVLAAGTAVFKPGIQGSLAQTLSKKNSSLGWSLFYALVNLGAWIGPYLAHYLKGIGWPAVFYGCAVIVALNFPMLLTYRDPPSGARATDGFAKVFVETMKNLRDLRLLVLILILAGFWMMMYQIWDLHPNFVVDWIDSTTVAEHLKVLPDFIRNRMVEQTSRGVQVSQEQMLNLNALLVMLLVAVVGHAVRNMRRLVCMQFGIILAIAGVLTSGLTSSGYIFLLGILFFSLGEMFTGPKKNEYFGLIAPPGKKGLYLGYVNIPIAIGAGVGAMIAGWAYGMLGEKAVLAQRYIAEHTPFGQRLNWSGELAQLESTLGVARSQAMVKLQELIGQDATATTELLWRTYAPYRVWYFFAAVGVSAALALFLFNRRARHWSDMNV
ncbi:MAG: MFS transporter [Deltaproteobacteria bacterium]|nr:MFS transporter [Deltaproteobacteria bacterium]